MGGEPTFVSIDDMDGAGVEHRRAVGRRSASWPATLLRRLRERFAPGGLLHYGQGKWYPGRAAAALGARRLLARPTASRCGATPR